MNPVHYWVEEREIKQLDEIEYSKIRLLQFSLQVNDETIIFGSVEKKLSIIPSRERVDGKLKPCRQKIKIMTSR